MKKLSWKMVDAVVDNDVEAVTKLLDSGHDVNATNDNDETAFSYACANDSWDVAKLLYSRNANINTVDKGNGSPLDWALQWSSREFCDWLEGVGGKQNDIGTDGENH